MRSPKVTLFAAIAVTFLMLCSAMAAQLMTPRQRLADALPRVDLAKVVPKRFGAWREDESVVPLMPDPTTAAQLATLYSQTLARTFVNEGGQRVMLSVAYGGDQSRELQVHRPEVCYAAQGFQVQDRQKADLKLPSGRSIPVMHIAAKKGSREEPITYWVRIGKRIVRGNVEQGLARMSYGLSGSVPDGLLFRVSSIGADSDVEYELQRQFVADLIAALDPAYRGYFVGSLGALAS